jgi:hypothetical protein
MPNLPITHITLYKHGVGFFERRARLAGEEISFTFRVEDMNDVLKSFTAVDWGGGTVLGVDYPTPQSAEERLAGSSVRLEERRSLRDLITALRGRRARLLLTQGERLDGLLVGLDEADPGERQPLAGTLVSLLVDSAGGASGGTEVRAVALERVEGVEILDEHGASDLRFFLEAGLSGEQRRPVTVRLSAGEHDLSVSYVAPAPTWRVSYRLLLESTGGEGQGEGKALLLGWGIFDNRLEEDLEGISLALVAGMPVSFVYDLYTPYTPSRPVISEGARDEAQTFTAEIAAMPRSVAEAEDSAHHPRRKMSLSAPSVVSASMRSAGLENFAEALPAQASGGALGAATAELFQYTIQTPVSVRRGQSAMVPIVSARLSFRRDLLYNAARYPGHPVAAARLMNTSGLTLERGPLTVLDGGAYVGEAVLPFTPTGAELVAPYAVELGVKVREESGVGSQVRALHLEGALLHIEEWQIQWREYRVNNTTAAAVRVLVEHPRMDRFELFESPEPLETTPSAHRFAVEAAAVGEAVLRVQQRALMRRVEDVRRVSHEGLRRFLQQGLIEPAVYERVTTLLRAWERIGDHEQEIQDLKGERETVYAAQGEIRSNMDVLGESGREGQMRSYYVDQLESSENQLRTLAARETTLREAVTRLNAEAEALLKELAK